MNENMDERMEGMIKSFNISSGNGYIIGSDDLLYYFELIGCINPEVTFNVNDVVVFEPHIKDNIKYAIDVDLKGRK